MTIESLKTKESLFFPSSYEPADLCLLITPRDNKNALF